MVDASWPDFTINIICHSDVELLRKTLPHNLENLCARSRRSFDVIMTIDGAETAPIDQLLAVAAENGVDEVRMRNRRRNCASGHASNNGHVHAFSDKTRYLLTLEADVAFFNLDSSFDPLDAFAVFFERHPDRPLLHRMDDYSCWVWQLEKVSPDIEHGVWSVNRVSSHFLVYNTSATRRIARFPDLHRYRETMTDWHNVEDEISHRLCEPAGPGIAFPAAWPIRVFHCDRKLHEGSSHYTQDIQIKLAIFQQRITEVSALRGRNSG